MTAAQLALAGVAVVFAAEDGDGGGVRGPGRRRRGWSDSTNQPRVRATSSTALSITVLPEPRVPVNRTARR